MDTALPTERKRRRAPDENRPADVITWDSTGKMKEIERWAASVIADEELPSAAKSAAWVLSFVFSSNPDARSWETRDHTATRFGLNINTFRQSLQWLERRGHIIRRMERVPRMKKPVQVTRPAIPRGVAVPYPSDVRPVAVPQPTPVATPHPDTVALPQTCILPTDPSRNPLGAEGVTNGMPLTGKGRKCDLCSLQAEGHYKLDGTSLFLCTCCHLDSWDRRKMTCIEEFS